jgi:hypothetical protein
MKERPECNRELRQLRNGSRNRAHGDRVDGNASGAVVTKYASEVHRIAKCPRIGYATRPGIAGTPFPSAHACALVGKEVGRRVLVPHRALEQFVRAHHPIATCRRLTAIPQETHRYRSGIL